MGRPEEIDRDALHRVLWRSVDRFNRVTFKSEALADELLISAYHFSRIVTQMCKQGRLVELARKKSGIRTYEVIDPKVWRGERIGEK